MPEILQSVNEKFAHNLRGARTAAQPSTILSVTEALKAAAAGRRVRCEDCNKDREMNKGTVVAALLPTLTLVACAQMGPTRGDSSAARSNSPAPGMNNNGEVIDATKVESGHGVTVKGLNDFDGEITGIAPANSCFTRLQIGMGLRQTVDTCGPPTDQGAYITGKAFIPFYFGSDRSRLELVYKGEGRLIFAGGAIGNYSGGNLIWIIHAANESGYR